MKRIQTASSADVRENEILVVKVDDVGVLLSRVEGRVYAVENRCAHLGWSMARGTIEASKITCPWHGSKYDLRSGENLDWVDSFAGMPMPRWTHKMLALGKVPKPLRTFEADEADGSVFVTIPGEASGIDAATPR